MKGWRAGCGVAVVGATTWLALLPSDAWPLATLAYAAVPAGLQPYLPEMTHLLGFAGLVVVFTALVGHPGVAAAGVLGFSTLLEMIQGWVPWREASWADVQVNLLAVALGLALVTGVTRLGLAHGIWGHAVTGTRAVRGRPTRAALSAAGVRSIVAEFERSFGRRDLRAEVRTLHSGLTQLTLRVPGGPRPAMALLARAIAAEAAARGRTLRIRVLAAEEERSV